MTEIRDLHNNSRTLDIDNDLHLLIKRCTEQNAFAQKVLYERYSRMIKAIVVRYITDKQQGEEVFNDIFYRVFTKIHLYKPTGLFEGWLKKLAVNTILNAIKSKGRYKPVLIETIEEEVFIPPEVFGKFTQDQLVKMIQELPRPQRTVFNLYVFEGYRHKEIADLLGFKEINSKWHLNSARQKLKKQLNLLESDG